MNFKTNYTLLKNAYYNSSNSQSSNPPGFLTNVKKPVPINYLLLHYLVINLPLNQLQHLQKNVSQGDIYIKH